MGRVFESVRLDVIILLHQRFLMSHSCLQVLFGGIGCSGVFSVERTNFKDLLSYVSRRSQSGASHNELKVFGDVERAVVQAD